jgi:cell division transport system permease protein
MLTDSFRRVVRSGIVSFWRNGAVSIASVLVFLVTLSIIAVLFLSRGTIILALEAIKNKVDVNVYLKVETSEEDALAMRNVISARPEVALVTYVSREEVLDEFKKRHEGDNLILSSLDELGGNPLSAELNIKAKDPSQYESIAKFLESQSAPANPTSVISKYNFNRNKEAIDTITGINQSVLKVGGYTALLFIIMAITVVFNTIRLAIYSSREEIGVMRLMGAGNNYIRGPFIVSGMVYGFIASVIVIIAFYPITVWVSGFMETYGGLDLLGYLQSNFPVFVFLVIGFGVGMGALASYLAVRRYLKV